MNESTVEKMRQLKFFGMLRAFKTSMEEHQQTMTGDELISFLIESEWDDRNNRRIERNVRNARFRYKSEMECIAFDIDRHEGYRIFYCCNFRNNRRVWCDACHCSTQSEKVTGLSQH